MASTTSTPNAAPTIIPPSFPVDLPKSATSAVGTRTLKIEGFPGGFFRDRPASLKSFLLDLDIDDGSEIRGEEAPDGRRPVPKKTAREALYL